MVRLVRGGRHCESYPSYRNLIKTFRGFFGFFLFMYDIQHSVICRPSDSTVSEDAGIEPRTVATTALAVRRSNNSARSHPRWSIKSYLSGAPGCSVHRGDIGAGVVGYALKDEGEHAVCLIHCHALWNLNNSIGCHREIIHIEEYSDTPKDSSMSSDTWFITLM
jgi:hypothetical protein